MLQTCAESTWGDYEDRRDNKDIIKGKPRGDVNSSTKDIVTCLTCCNISTAPSLEWSHLTTFGNLNDKLRAVVRPSLDGLNLPQGEHPVDDAAKDDVLPVEKVALGGRDEKLAAVGVGTGIGHG